MNFAFFAEMAWKSALISGAALMLAALLRSRSAADRALVLRLGVAMLLLLPLIALWLPALEIVAFAAPQAAPLSHGLAPEVQLAGFAAAPAAPEPTIWDDPTPLVLLAYLGGLAMVGSRLLAGLWTLHGWTRRAREVDCPEWRAAFDRVRWMVPDADSVRLLVSDEVNSPLSWGWRRPAILLDTDTLGQPEDAEAILAHEAAHVARRDWPMLMMSQLAATLFWFNPLVWRLEREVVQQAEEAADIEAARRVEPARYAETLLSWAQVNPMLPANSIAPSTSALGRRVRAILDRRLRERPSGSAWTALAMLACIAIAAPVAATRLVAASPEAQPPAGPEAPEAPFAPAAPAPDLRAAPAVSDEDELAGDAVADAAAAADEALASVVPQIPAIVANAMAGVDPEAMEEALREAESEIRRMPRVDGEEVRAAMREARAAHAVSSREVQLAMREARAAQAVSRREIRLAMREARRVARDVPRQVAASMARGADGMMRGADGMERGAANMERESQRLQDRDYRERQIARARARGETVTHEQLLEAAEGMREGAQGMREGAQDMREAAREMRERHD